MNYEFDEMRWESSEFYYTTDCTSHDKVQIIHQPSIL